jgi:ABC-type branched-subunit amino acid transport system permease subunit
MTTYRLFTLIGTLAAVVVWGLQAPLLLEMTRVGEMSAVVLLLFAVAVIALAVAGVRVQLGKKGQVSFGLHILFACGAASMTGMFFPRLPLALSLVVAVVALILSFTAQPAAPTAIH